MNFGLLIPSFTLNVVRLFKTSFFSYSHASSSSTTCTATEPTSASLPNPDTVDSRSLDQEKPPEITESTAIVQYGEPQNVTECPAGQGFDCFTMAEDLFIHDLACGFTALVLERYRYITGTWMSHCATECGMYAVEPNRRAGRPSLRDSGDFDARNMSYEAGTLSVRPCSYADASICLLPRSRHQCVDVQAVARRFMLWYIECRARVQRVMDPQLECVIAVMFGLHSERCDEEDERDWDWRRYAIYNLIRELRDPQACRPGYIKPEDGQPLRRPWEEGDQYIHGVMDWHRRNDLSLLYEIRGAMLVAERERKLRRRDPELATDLWDMAWREKPDRETLPRWDRTPDATSNPKRTHDKEDSDDWETRPCKMARIRLRMTGCSVGDCLPEMSRHVEAVGQI